ncbi:MAG: hypothetical protein PF692_09445 [Kiritimatiellae bacterium]|jgi:hypothetical protein|nr:hypothetical protein [Kiritimatiellia bacterium]
MRDLGTLLTTTGVVATLFAVFFAATGMYLQYRKGKQAKRTMPMDKENHHGTSPGSLVPFEQQPHVEVSEGGKIEKEDIINNNDKYVPPMKKASNPKNHRQAMPSTSVFKKYMPSGVESTSLDDSTDYIWE